MPYAFRLIEYTSLLPSTPTPALVATPTSVRVKLRLPSASARCSSRASSWPLLSVSMLSNHWGPLGWEWGVGGELSCDWAGAGAGNWTLRPVAEHGCRRRSPLSLKRTSTLRACNCAYTCDTCPVRVCRLRSCRRLRGGAAPAQRYGDAAPACERQHAWRSLPAAAEGPTWLTNKGAESFRVGAAAAGSARVVLPVSAPTAGACSR
jgi:hypothetical protein